MLPMSSFSPAAVMVYTDLQELKGLDHPVDYGSGTEYADGILNTFFPNQGIGLQVGLWLNGKDGCHQIINGELDEQIQKLRSYVMKKIETTPVFLRIGYEFDNPWFGYSPESYVQAYQKLVDALRGIDNLMFVWHSWAAPRAAIHEKTLTLESFYPGDDYVDWVGISIFQQVYPKPPYWGGKLTNLEEVLEFAKKHNKPTMIAESAPYGGIYNNSLSGTDDIWDSWFGPVIDLIKKYDISMWCYINCNWEEQPMWHSVGFGDTRLSSSTLVTQKWIELILQSNNKGTIDGSNQLFLTAASLQQNCASKAEESLPIHLTGILFVSGLILFICCGKILHKILLMRATSPNRIASNGEQTGLLTGKL